MAKYLEMFGKRYGEIIVKTTVLRWLTLVGAVLTLIVTVLMWVRINQQNVFKYSRYKDGRNCILYLSGSFDEYGCFSDATRCICEEKR